MAVKIIDLQVLYGVAGAREKFEALCEHLIKSEQPSADKIRVSRGDGGLDVHVGELTSPDGIEIYQCKFFPQGLDDSQKGQIRESFRTCRSSYKLKRWTLCLPLDLSKPEKIWFEKWRAEQAEHGVEITDVWGATKLEHLLYQHKNDGTRNVFFKEEHFAQIRELHSKLLQWIPDLIARLNQDPMAEARDAEAQARSDTYLEQSVSIQRDRYLKLNPPAPLSLSDLQEAKRRGDHQYAARLQQASRRPEYWQIAISPARMPDKSRFASLGECWAAVEAAHEKRIGRQFLTIKHEQRQTGSDWTGSSDVCRGESECWSMSQRGLFTHLFTLFDDVNPPKPSEALTRYMPPHSPAPRFIDIDMTVWTVTEAFRFALRLADAIVDSGSDSIRIGIRINGTQNLVLTARDDPARMTGWYVCTLDALEHAWTYTRDELKADPDGTAARALVWYLERFNMPAVSEELVAQIQKQVDA